MNYLVYYVAIGATHREYARQSLESLYIGGYTGNAHVVTDVPWTPKYAPEGKVTFVTDSATNVFAAKMKKASYPLSINLSTFDAILFVDCDTLIRGDITSVLDKVAANPTKLYLGLTGGLKLLQLAGMAEDITVPLPDDTLMIDSYIVGIVPNEVNLGTLALWKAFNESQGYTSDACTLNIVVANAGRWQDIEILTEAERLRGRPSPGTLVEHYVKGQTVRMPLVYANEIEAPSLTEKMGENGTTVLANAD